MERESVFVVLGACLAACLLLLTICFGCMYLTGCSIDPHDAAIEGLQSNVPEHRLAAIETSGSMRDQETLRRLIETFAYDADTRGEAAKALVRRGREEFKRHPKGNKDGNRNVVIVELEDLASRADIHPAVRAKAVWCMAEIGDRREKAAIAAAYAADSTAVAAEKTIALDKLGFTAEAHEMELLADGHTLVANYDPRERGHVEEVEP